MAIILLYDKVQNNSFYYYIFIVIHFFSQTIHIKFAKNLDVYYICIIIDIAP